MLMNIKNGDWIWFSMGKSWEYTLWLLNIAMGNGLWFMRIYFLETVILLAASLLFALPLLQIEVQQVLLRRKKKRPDDQSLV